MVLSLRVLKSEGAELDALAKELGSTRVRVMRESFESLVEVLRMQVNERRVKYELPAWEEDWSFNG